MRKLCIAILLGCVGTLQARQPRTDRATKHSENAVMKRMGDYALSAPSWIDSSTYVSYYRMEDGELVRYMMNAETGNEERLIADLPSFIRQYRELTGDSTFSSTRMRYFSIRFLNGNPRWFTFGNGKSEKMYDRLTGVLTSALIKKESSKTNGYKQRSRSAITSDSMFTMLGDKYNLYMRNNVTGKQRQLTTDGKELASYCYRSAKDTLCPENVSGTWYGHRFINFVQDDSEVGNLYIINALAQPRPKLETKKMPLPNEKGVRRFKLFWYNADTDEARWLPIDKFKDQNVVLNDLRNGRDIYFTRRSRGVDTLELCRIDVLTGAVKTLITEVSKPHINVNEFNYRLINGNRNIIWWSDRTGRGNYYLYDVNGRLLNRITQGNRLVAGQIVHVDSVSRRIVFAGYGAEEGIDPNYTLYYSVGWNGKGQQLLTPENGTHDLTFSFDKRFALNKYSRMDLPAVYTVLSVSRPKQKHEVLRVDTAALQRAGWIKPMLICVDAADEKTPLYGVMYLPSDFTPDKKYPIISNVYPGPQSDQIPRAFTIDDNGNQSLAELGFVVINIQPRGSSPIRDKSFYTFGYGNLRDYAVADDKHTIERLAARYPFIDITRVGIYGHSGGGAETVTAMLTYPEFYKVGVASSGNHDNNIYIQWWAETYHGLRKVPTNMELAGNLKGKLLLISGDVDDNVPYASTLRMADALIKAGKRFDMFIFPGMDHSVYGAYYDNMIRQYFYDHLLKPSAENP